MAKYTYNEDYLLMLVHERSDDAIEELYGLFSIAIRCKAYKYKNYGSKIGLDIEDLIQEGYIGFSQAIIDYNNTSNAAFRTFANICVEREIQNAIASASRKKHGCLNEAVSINNETMQGVEFVELIVNTKTSTEDIVIGSICEQAEYESILELLTQLERRVFILKYAGYEYREIARTLNLSSKVVDNALQRIKKKVRGVISG